MTDNKQAAQSAGGVSLLGLLALLFIGLKLTGSITWPWLWVVAPLWIPVALAVLLLLIGALILRLVKRV